MGKQVDEIWLDVVIENWCRWHRSGLRWKRGRCKSIESRYRRTSGADDAPPTHPLGRVNIEAAEMVESAWRLLPFVPKMVLKEYFVFKQRSGRVCRSLRQKGFPVIDRDFPLEIVRARSMLMVEIDKLMQNDKILA
jgi:hypothetical protein